jgi:predicted transcriptional regulator
MVLLAARRPCRLLAVVLQADYVGYVGLPCTNTYAPFCLFAALMKLFSVVPLALTTIFAISKIRLYNVT